MNIQFEHAFDFDMPPERLFAFHENPDNLALLLRDWPTFRMISNDGNIRVGAVTRIQEQMGLVWVPLTFEHFVYEPPHRFGERQVRGPFRKFEHIHEFVASGLGTVLRDVLDVRLPWYLGAGLAMRLIVAPKLRRFFAFRHAELERLVREGVVEQVTS